MSISFSQKTVLELAGIGNQQFRNWKKVILKGLPASKASSFSITDLTAIFFLSQLVNEVGVQVKSAALYAAPIFELCTNNGLDDFAGCVVVLNVKTYEANLRPVGALTSADSEIVLAPEAMIKLVRDALLHGGAQFSLPLAVAR